MSVLAHSPASGNSPAVIVPAKSTDENVNMLQPLIDECQTHCGAINSRSRHERRYKSEISLLSMAFLFVFSAFGATQNLQTSINREAGLGSVTLGIFYSSFTICSFVAPAVVQSLGSKHAMLAGFCGFWIYLFANFWPTWAVLVPASLLLGFSASILWVAQGTYLSSVAKAHAAQLGSSEAGSMGEFNGHFWSVQALNQVAGNLTVLVICSALEGSIHVTAGTIQPTTRLTLLAVFLVNMTGGTMAACFLPAEPEGKSDGRKREGEKSSVLSLGRDFAGVLGERKLQLLIPLLFYSGLQRAFIWMSFTRDLVSPVLGVAGIGATMVVYGLTDSMSSLISGRLSTGPAAVFRILRIGLACQAAVIIVVALEFSEALALPRTSVSSLYVGAILWAVGAAALNTQISALLPLQFPHHTAAAFSHWKFWQSGATAAACLMDPWVSMGQRQGMLMVLLLASMLTLSCSTAADGDVDDDGYVGDVA